MQPAEGSFGGGRRNLRRWGPLAAVLVVAAVVGALVVAGDGEGGDADGAGTSAPSEQVEEVITFSIAESQGLEVDWPDTCDTSKGRIAIPTNYAGECVAPFSGDNGGSTAPGVTSDSIRVVYYISPPDPFVDTILDVIEVDDTPEQASETLQGFVELFGAYYETYGRSVELIPFEGTATSLDEVAARGDAEQIAEQHDPFMVWGGPLLTETFADELAAQGILNISLAAPMRDEFYVERGPWLWSILPTPEQSQTHLATYVGRRLAAGPAEFAGDPSMQDRERTFGRIRLALGPDADYLGRQFAEELGAYGVELAADLTYTDPITLPNVAAQKIAQMKEAGVTTVLFFGDPLAPKTLTEEATRQEFFPEWVIPGSYLVDTTVFARTYDQDQWAHAFGPTSLWARGLPTATFAYHLYEWFVGEPPPADNSVAVLFPMPMMLFNGVQAAGPELTPETFRAGLFSAPPVPGGLSHPGVSFGEHGYWTLPDYAAIDDMAELWWDPSATGPDERGEEGSGMYQYTDGGRRYLPGDWPEGPPRAFDPEGAVSLYLELPSTDASGDYPSPNS